MKNNIQSYEVFELAKKYSSEKKFNLALQYFTKCSKFKEFKADIIFEKAKIFYELNELEKSSRYFLKYINISSNQLLKSNSIIILSKIYKLKNKIDKAMALLDSMDKKLVKSEWERERLDISYYKFNDLFRVHEFSGKKTDLIKEFEVIQTITPNNGKDLFYISRISNYLHNYEFTEKLIKENIKLMNKADAFYKNAILNELEISTKTVVLKSKPRGLWIAASSKCNISCIMCFSKDIKWELTDKNIEDIYSYMPYLEHIVWWGGEPTISKKFYEMINYSLQYKHIKHTVVTNGQYMPEKFIDIVINNSIEVAFSIDSVDKKKYEEIRKGASFDKLIENIIKLYPLAKKKLLKINSVIADYNVKEINEILKFAKKWSFRTVSFRPMISKNITNNMLQPTFKYLMNMNKMLKAKSKVEVNNSIQILLDKDCNKNCASKGFCHTPWCYLTIRFDGKIFPDNLCSYYMKETFDLTNTNYLKYWNSKYISNFRQYIIDNQSCSPMCPQANILEKI